MNLGIYVIECVVLCLAFGILVLSILLRDPVSMVFDYPPEIQERYYRTQKKEAEKQKMTFAAIVRKTIALVVCFCLFAWMAYIAGGDTFGKALLMAYGYMIVLFSFDTFFLDWVLFANIKQFRLPGTEDMDKEYHQKWFHVKACIPMVPIFFIAGFGIAGLTMLFAIGGR